MVVVVHLCNIITKETKIIFLYLHKKIDLLLSLLILLMCCLVEQWHNLYLSSFSFRCYICYSFLCRSNDSFFISKRDCTWYVRLSSSYRLIFLHLLSAWQYVIATLHIMVIKLLKKDRRNLLYTKILSSTFGFLSHQTRIYHMCYADLQCWWQLLVILKTSGKPT